MAVAWCGGGVGGLVIGVCLFIFDRVRVERTVLFVFLSQWSLRILGLFVFYHFVFCEECCVVTEMRKEFWVPVEQKNQLHMKSVSFLFLAIQFLELFRACHQTSSDKSGFSLMKLSILSFNVSLSITFFENSFWDIDFLVLNISDFCLCGWEPKNFRIFRTGSHSTTANPSGKNKNYPFPFIEISVGNDDRFPSTVQTHTDTNPPWYSSKTGRHLFHTKSRFEPQIFCWKVWVKFIKLTNLKELEFLANQRLKTQ